jgi:hypothetical protein
MGARRLPVGPVASVDGVTYNGLRKKVSGQFEFLILSPTRSMTVAPQVEFLEQQP